MTKKEAAEILHDMLSIPVPKSVSGEAIKIAIEALMADSAEIVRCKKCVYSYYDETFDKWWCNHSGCVATKADGFCRRGIRRKDGKDEEHGID